MVYKGGLQMKVIDFYGKRYLFFGISILIILCGLIGYIVNGVSLDIQFEGGTLMKFVMQDGNFDTDKIQAEIRKELGKSITAQKLQTYNPSNENEKLNVLSLRVSKQDALTGDEINKVIQILKNDFGLKEGADMQIQNVAPFIGREMLEKGILAAVIASVLIVFYVWWRFSVMSGLSAAIFANVALIHDALVMLSFYLIFRFPLNESFLAALLTILGYSINDTIIIYDRIRENSKFIKKTAYGQLINTSIVQTLSRTINTTVTTLICIITILVFASANNISSLKEFTLPLTVGLVSGTYSTIFIASPLWAMWQEHKLNKVAKAKASKA
jgi:preprotein translocase subunit SecF